MAKLGVVALGDTQNDSTQSWNFGKNWSNSMADSKLADKNSIQTVIQFIKIQLKKIRRWFHSIQLEPPVSDEKVFVCNEKWVLS